MGFLEDLQNNVLIADGAIGTLLHSYGIDNCFEELNLSQPDQVLNIHKSYLHAGAQVIQTNTYGANSIKLSRYGLESDVDRINKKAVQLAKEAAEDQAYVLGTIGGIRGIQKGVVTLEEITQSFREQLNALLSEGVDGILLETYYDLQELTTVLGLAREETSLPIVAQVSVHEPGIMQNGTPLTEALATLEKLGANVIGLNCRLGPYHMIEALAEIPLPRNAFLSVYPNAGLPEYVDGRTIYQSQPSYFEESAFAFRDEGARLIGGCCGTTPAHIEALADALRGVQPVTSKRVKKGKETVTVVDPAKKADPSLHEIVRDRQSVIVELDPPKKLSIDRFLEGARALKKEGVDALTLADNSLASPRISNVSLASLVQNKYNLRPLVHVACRDRNLIGLQSHLMGLHTLGMNQVLAITGDPTKVGDFPGTSSVYDCTSFDLIELCKQFNEGISYSGKPLGEKTSFSVGAAFNPNVHRLDKAVRRLEKKIASGADYFMTQPLFSEQQIIDVYEATKHLSVPIYIGIMPLVSSRNAEFLHNEVPGMKLSDEIRSQMAAFTNDRVGASREGVTIAKSLLDTAMDLFNGIYLITPFMRYEMTAELVRYIHRSTAKTKTVNTAHV